jgi:hypothetical protein
MCDRGIYLRFNNRAIVAQLAGGGAWLVGSHRRLTIAHRSPDRRSQIATNHDSLIKTTIA